MRKLWVVLAVVGVLVAGCGFKLMDMQRKAFAEIWTRFNRHFRIARYAQLQPAKMGEAVEYLVGMEVKAAVAALPQGKQEIEPSTIKAHFREDWPKDMKNGRKDAMKKLQAITWQLRGALDVTRIFSHPGGYSCGRTVAEKERYDILMNLYHVAEANIVSAYQALEAGYRLGREVGRG